jgi:hypothetical protein
VAYDERVELGNVHPVSGHGVQVGGADTRVEDLDCMSVILPTGGSKGCKGEGAIRTFNIVVLEVLDLVLLPLKVALDRVGAVSGPAFEFSCHC